MRTEARRLSEEKLAKDHRLARRIALYRLPKLVGGIQLRLSQSITGGHHPDAL